MKAKTYRQTGRLAARQFDRSQTAAWLWAKRASLGRPNIYKRANGRAYQWPDKYDSVYTYLVIAH